MCSNFYYKQDKPFCKNIEDICAYTKFCSLENRWKLSERSSMCKKYNVPPIDIPQGAYEVLFEKRNKLYVKTENQTITVDNPFDYVPKYVFLDKGKVRYDT